MQQKLIGKLGIVIFTIFELQVLFPLLEKSLRKLQDKMHVLCLVLQMK